ncbi:hypothetical protein CCP3SC1_2470001 [Gammaproteobacteria bacterium]
MKCPGRVNDGKNATDGDDEDDLPWITGSTGFTSSNRGERDTENRVMPPMSIRLPGMGNSYYSYSGLDPLASLLSGTVDVANDVKQSGGMDAQVVGRFFKHVQNAMADKTYLKGLSDIGKAWSSPDKFVPQVTSNIVTGFVPNLIRQPIREMDKVQRDIYPRAEDGIVESWAKRIGYAIVPQSAPPKITVWGDEFPSNMGEQIGGAVTDSMIRIIDPGNLTIGAKIDPIDRYIFNWNNMAADNSDKIQMTPIENFITAKVDGKMQKIPLTAEEQRMANINVGRAARTALGQEWDFKNPTEQGAKQIGEIYSALQTAEKQRIRDSKLVEMLKNK